MEEQPARKKQRKLLGAAEGHTAEFDLLSRLPEHLIHRVLSRLPLREIVKAHLVCKSWRRILSSFPVLDIDFSDVVGKHPTMENMRGRVERIASFVDATMTRFQERHLKVDKFGMDYPYVGVGEQHVCLSRMVRWTTIALDHNAREIDIGISDFTPGKSNVPHEPPSLHLSGSTDLLGGSSSLRILTLSGFQAGEFLSWRGLMSACLSLQSLSLSGCHLKEVRISGLPNLKSLSITQCTSTRLVEIQAPILESFYIDGGSERTGCVIDMDHCPNLKRLTLARVAVDDRWFLNFTSVFRRLQDLTVRRCKSLTRIRISNPLIESVDIQGCPNLTHIRFEAPELRRFHLCTLGGLLPSISMKNPPRSNPVAKVEVSFLEPPPDWSCKLREFLVGSCKSFSSLRFYADTEVYVCELNSDIKYGWSGVIACHFKQLCLARRGATQEALAKAVDGIDVKGLLWTPHPATVTAVGGGSSGDDFLQLFCNKAAERQRCSEEDCTASDSSDAEIVIVTGSCSN